MVNYSFSIGCFGFMVLLFFLCIIKKVNLKEENRIYFYIVISSMIGIGADCISYIMIQNGISYDNFVFELLTRFVLMYYDVYCLLFILYIFMVCNRKKNRREKNKNGKVILLGIFLPIIFISNLFLPISFYSKNNIFYPEGIAVMKTYIFASLSICFMIFYLIKNRKYIMSKEFLPLVLLIIFSSFAIIIQYLLPGLILLTWVEAFITFIMYFTIENPDVKMIEQLNIAKEDAEKANRAKTDFLSSMSHEIRTPLNAIVGFSECLLQADDLSEAKENAEDIVVASKTLLEIVNSILDISKIEAGKIEIHNSSYKPNELFSEIERLIRARLGDKELEFRVSIAPDIPEVLYGDHSNIKKVIINLLTNALKYTDQGYFTFEVKCINKNKICRLMIDVKDTGRGIKKENLDKLFTKFQRLDEDRNTTIEGTGLGLAITKQLVELMGGKIIVQSQYGEGSKFSVILDQQISNENINSENVIVVDNLDLSGKKILVVDDNKLNIKVASKILSKYNLNIDSAESGMECLEKIKNGSSYDIIFMDDMMPRMNGGETLLRLKQIEGFKTPVIALTANAINGMKEKYLNQGFNDYLSKPIEKDELHQVLCKYLRDSKEEKNEIEKEEIVYKDYSNKKVLIVDDNKMNIKVASHIMKPYNFEIDEALSGEECLNIIKNKEYDLIFMDYMMPDMDGIETLKNLKKIEGFKTPVIALTADAVVGAREKFLKAGFDEYVSKPIIKESLNKAIDIVLNKN